MDKTNVNIATQVLIKAATELVTNKAFSTLDDATTELVKQYEKVLRALNGETSTPVESPKLEVTKITKPEETRTYDDVKADAKSHKSYTTAFGKLESLTTKEELDDLRCKISDSKILTGDMKASLLALAVRKEELIIKQLGV